MKYIDKLSTLEIEDLLTEMRISKNEDIKKLKYIKFAGKLRVVHGKTENGENIESIYTDYEIQKIYNSVPSNYDQRKFQNSMVRFFKNYAADLEEYQKSEKERI